MPCQQDEIRMKLRRFAERAVLAMIGVVMVGYIFIHVAWVKDEVHKSTRQLHEVDSTLHQTSPPKENSAFFRRHPKIPPQKLIFQSHQEYLGDKRPNIVISENNQSIASSKTNSNGEHNPKQNRAKSASQTQDEQKAAPKLPQSKTTLKTKPVKEQRQQLDELAQPPKPHHQPPLSKATPTPKVKNFVPKPKPGQNKRQLKSNQEIKKRPPSLVNFPVAKASRNYLDKSVILTTTTFSYVDFTENWLHSINRTGGVHPQIYIIAEDAKTYEHLQNRTLKAYVNVIKAPQLEAQSSLYFDTLEYKNFVNKRPQYILDILNSGHDVIFSDVDTVWLHRPYRFFLEDFDIFAQLDQGPPKPTVLCAGFVMYRNTNATKRFVERWIAEIDSFPKPKPDQIVLNRLLDNKTIIDKPVPDIKVKILDPFRFVSGQYYFDVKWRRKNPQVKPIVLHNNWIKGHDPKVERFKKLGKWWI